MDHEIFEHSYYYVHHNPQGESDNDELSWLTYLDVLNSYPTMQVGNTIKVVSNVKVSSIQPTIVPNDSNHPSSVEKAIEVITKPLEIKNDHESIIPLPLILLYPGMNYLLALVEKTLFAAVLLP